MTLLVQFIHAQKCQYTEAGVCDTDGYLNTETRRRELETKNEKMCVRERAGERRDKKNG